MAMFLFPRPLPVPGCLGIRLPGSATESVYMTDAFPECVHF
jgi:hypothetical protein